MGENQWEEIRNFLPFPSWRTMQRLRGRALAAIFPVDDLLDGSDASIDVLVRLLPVLNAPFTSGREADYEYTLQCDALQAKPWVAIDREGRVHGAVDSNRGETVTQEDLAAIFEDPSAFPKVAAGRAAQRKVANACFVFTLTSTAPGSPTFPVRLIRSSSGKANQDIAAEIDRLWTVLHERGVPLGRMAMDGDNVFVQFLGLPWSALRPPENWIFHLDIRHQVTISQLLMDHRTAITDPSHWVKAFRYDKLKPGHFYVLGPVQAGFGFDSDIFRDMGFSRGSLLNDSASKMDYGLAARFVRVEHLMRLREAHGNIQEAIDVELEGADIGVIPGSGVTFDYVELDRLHAQRRRVASAYWALLPVTCLHLVTTSSRLTADDRLTIALYGLAAMLLPYWERVGLSELEGNVIPFQKRSPRSAMGGHIWAHSEEAVKKFVTTMFHIAQSIATAHVPIRASAFGSMGEEHFFAMLRRLAGHDQRADVLADRAELAFLKLYLRSQLKLPKGLDAGTHRPGERSVVFEPLVEGVEQPPLSLTFSRVKTAMARMGLPLLQTGHVDTLSDWDQCFLEDLVRLPNEPQNAMATSVSEGLVRVAATRQMPYRASEAQLLQA
jgi:hypothetical protein